MYTHFTFLSYITIKTLKDNSVRDNAVVIKVTANTYIKLHVSLQHLESQPEVGWFCRFYFCIGSVWTQDCADSPLFWGCVHNPTGTVEVLSKNTAHLFGRGVYTDKPPVHHNVTQLRCCIRFLNTEWSLTAACPRLFRCTFDTENPKSYWGDVKLYMKLHNVSLPAHCGHGTCVPYPAISFIHWNVIEMSTPTGAHARTRLVSWHLPRWC